MPLIGDICCIHGTDPAILLGTGLTSSNHRVKPVRHVCQETDFLFSHTGTCSVDWLMMLQAGEAGQSCSVLELRLRMLWQQGKVDHTTDADERNCLGRQESRFLIL